MAEFPTILSAEIRVPEEGFTPDELRAHLRSQKIPTDAKVKPVVVGNAMDPSDDREVRFRVEWQTSS